MTLQKLLNYFQIYDENKAPFLHRQLLEWQKTRPLTGLSILHHVPLVPKTLLKIACLVASGAEVTVTNPSFLIPHEEAISALQADNITYVPKLTSLKGKMFDLYFDYNAELYRALGQPKHGSIELTGSGDQFYREQTLTFPVISIDRTYTKQLETVFGVAESAHHSISQLTGLNLSNQSWLIFGFGKIGRGLAYYCVNHDLPIIVVDVDAHARFAAQSFGIPTIHPSDTYFLKVALSESNIVVTATGRKSVLDPYPKQWFKDKILANMGVLDEFGDQFNKNDVLNEKMSINSVLEDPTPIRYIDPELYAHNFAALQLLENHLPSGVSDLSKTKDLAIIDDWCRYHQESKEVIQKWFIKN